MIGLFSSDEYLDKIYDELTKKGLKVDFLITESPKPSGRGLNKKLNKAHDFARGKGIDVFTPTSFDNTFSGELKMLVKKNHTKLGFVYSYGKIIPENIIQIFPKGIINVHFSLLPQYRGASPIQRALLEGSDKTGLTFFLIDKGLDTGLILKQKMIEISPYDNFTSLKKKSLECAVSLLPNVILDYLGGKLLPQKQNSKGISYTSEFKKQDGLINPSETVERAMNKIRAFCEFPRTFIQIDDKRIIINKAHIENKFLVLDEVQLPNRNAISFTEFKNGYPSLLTKLPPFVKI